MLLHLQAERDTDACGRLARAQGRARVAGRKRLRREATGQCIGLYRAALGYARTGAPAEKTVTHSVGERMAYQEGARGRLAAQEALASDFPAPAAPRRRGT